MSKFFFALVAGATATIQAHASGDANVQAHLDSGAYLPHEQRIELAALVRDIAAFVGRAKGTSFLGTNDDVIEVASGGDPSLSDFEVSMIAKAAKQVATQSFLQLPVTADDIAGKLEATASRGDAPAHVSIHGSRHSFEQSSHPIAVDVDFEAA